MRRQRGLNENYGRELLELHTLGVDGGYTQKDVTEVARCFTGWTIRQPQREAEFEFNPRMHDEGEKIVLGVRIPAGGGIDDGYKVLDLLAHHPSTAHFISRELAMRFVADDPPAALVDRMADTFLKKDGDLRAVLKTMFDSPEFWSRGAYRSKMKSPLEMVASSVRAVNARRGFHVRPEQPIDAARRAALPQSRADRLFELRPGMVELGRPAGAHELQRGAGQQQGARSQSGSALRLAQGVTLGSPDFQKK